MPSRIPANTFGPPLPVTPLPGGLDALASPPIVDGRDRSVRLCSLDPWHPQAASRSDRARKRTPRRSLRLRPCQRLRSAQRQDLGSTHSTRAFGRMRRQPAEPLGWWRTQRTFPTTVAWGVARAQARRPQVLEARGVGLLAREVELVHQDRPLTQTRTNESAAAPSPMKVAKSVTSMSGQSVTRTNKPNHNAIVNSPTPATKTGFTGAQRATT